MPAALSPVRAPVEDPEADDLEARIYTASVWADHLVAQLEQLTEQFSYTRHEVKDPSQLTYTLSLVAKHLADQLHQLDDWEFDADDTPERRPRRPAVRRVRRPNR
jgi:hypothetical protein